MTDRRSRALTAARIRLRSPVPRPELDSERIDEVCAELLETRQEADDLAADNERLRGALGWEEPQEGTQQPRLRKNDTEAAHD